MKVSVPSVLALFAAFVPTIVFAITTDSYSTNSQVFSSNAGNLGVFPYGAKSGTFTYYKTGSANASIKVDFCKFGSSGCNSQYLIPTTQKQTYKIDAPFKDLNVAFSGKTDNSNTTVFSTLSFQ